MNPTQIKFEDIKFKEVFWQLLESCNLDCVMCMYAKSRNQSYVPTLSKEIIFRTVEEIANLGIPKIKFTGGELLLYKDLYLLLSAIKKHDIYIQITSNGTLMNREKISKLVEHGVKRFVFSIDGGDREEYKKIRGYDGLPTIIESIRTLNEFKKKGYDIKMKVNTVLMKSNYKGLPKLAQLIKSLGIEEHILLPVYQWIPSSFGLTHYEIHELNSMLEDYLGNTEDASLLYPYGKTEEEMQHAVQGNYAHGFYEKFPCFLPWNMITILANGNISICPYLSSNPNFVVGSLGKNTLLEILNSDKMKILREERKNGQFNSCKECFCYMLENKNYLKKMNTP